MPDFIGLKGDTSDQIAGVPGIGDKTAGQLIAQFGSLENLLDSIDEVSGAKRKETLRLYADQARQSKLLATMRRDLDIDFDPAELVRGQPDRSALKEMFRRFEFRNLLQRVDELDSALPAAPVAVVGVEMPWREELSASLVGEVGVAFDDDRIAVATEDEVVVAPRPGRVDGTLVVHDAKAAGVDATDDTMLLAYLVEPGRASYQLDELAAEYGIELQPFPRPRRRRRARPRAAATRAAGPVLERLRDAAPRSCTARSSCRPRACSPRWSAGLKIDTYRMGEITARLADRVEELETQAYELADEEFISARPSKSRASCSRSSG